MLVMVVFFIAFRWIHLSTPLIRLFLLVLILLLMPTLNFLPVWFALCLIRLLLPSRMPMMFIFLMIALLLVIILFLLLFLLVYLYCLSFLFALSLLRVRLPSRLPIIFILWMVAMMVVIIPSRTV